jgi:Carboxypeptidase regulatory-like domain
VVGSACLHSTLVISTHHWRNYEKKIASSKHVRFNVWSSSATNLSRTATSSTDGVFSFEQVPVGDYRMEVTATGFKKAIVTAVHALVARVTPIDFRLEVGNVSETVTVTSTAAENLINRDDGTLGNNFVNQQITQLPLEARSPLALLTLQQGVTKEGYVAGARTDQSNVTLDGIDITMRKPTRSPGLTRSRTVGFS